MTSVNRVSQVDFEQSKDLNPNQEKGSNIEYKSQQDEGSGKERTEKVETVGWRNKILGYLLLFSLFLEEKI